MLLLLGHPAGAADLKVLCIPGLKAAVDELLPDFESASGQKVDVTYEIYAGQQKRIDAGDFDVALFAKSQIAEMAKQHRLAPAPIADVATTAIGVAVRAGAAKPDISDEQRFKSALLAAKSITYTKESSTGVYLTGLLDRLGLTPMIKDKLILQSSGAATAPAVAAGKAELGIVLLSDILATPGVALVGPLPPTLQNQVTQTAAVGSRVTNAKTADLFVEFLESPLAGAVFRAKGLEPPKAN